MNPIGIMQGRLSPPPPGRIQAFPATTWREEFGLAVEAGLDCIEWIYEEDTERHNPLRDDDAISEIVACVDETGIAVSSICADWFMTDHLLDDHGQPRREALSRLEQLLGRVAAIGARYVVLPFVDSSSLVLSQDRRGLLAAVRGVLPAAERYGVELHLETDLAPQELCALLDEIDHPFARANYDSGNSASLGYDPRVELTLLAPHLGSFHVKDRIRGGGTVPLGQGDADLPLSIELAVVGGFSGPFILQAAREDGTTEVELATRNRALIEQLASRATSPA